MRFALSEACTVGEIAVVDLTGIKNEAKWALKNKGIDA